ncbi:hypothetical protein [Porphyromonas sp. CAG:1061]|uniref:hypothetical protein n=1 Tax=Porphyromonas sp. CAG:1061 TaxID=1262916 RepID=UPI0025909AF7|nr:hypothetical protein [Porphyromonas sp. CAG:1061]
MGSKAKKVHSQLKGAVCLTIFWGYYLYMPKANITSVLKKEWITKLNVVYPKIKFEIIALEDFIK